MASLFVVPEHPGSDWPVIEAWLREAAQRGDPNTVILAPDEILFVAREMQGDPPVGVAVGAATAGVTADGAEVVLAGGEMRAVLPILERIIEWARSVGAPKLFCAGRKGWDKVSPFREIGEEDGMTLYELDLTNG